MFKKKSTKHQQNDTFDSKEDDLKSNGLDLGVHLTSNNRLKVSVLPPSFPSNMKRLPVIVCCVVDISGSMGVEATIKDASGKEESHGLSILDLVKHSIKTIIECLTDTDYLSIVSYSSKAEVVTDLMPMTKKNKKKTIAAMNDLHPNGATNLWDGLFNGLETLRNNKHIECHNQNSAVMLFTDGLPNIIPPKGHQAMLEKYIDTHQQLASVINTYGFGYSLDTPLLNELAVRGNGSFAFIPDSSFIGTIFVNSISNLCSNMAKNCVVKIETDHKKYEVRVVGSYDHLVTSWGVQINLGNVSYGQSKDIVLEFGDKENDDTNDDNDEEYDESNEGQKNEQKKVNMFNVDVDSLSYVSLRSGNHVEKAGNVFDDDANGMKTELHYYRLLACDTMRECMAAMRLNDIEEAQKKIKDLVKEIESNKKVQKEKFAKDLVSDLVGQAFEAISKKQYFDKWGKHYLPSLIFAHLHEYNNNFKDPGVQNYGGKLFEELRDKGNDIFIKLEAPKPSLPKFLQQYQAQNNNNNNNANANAYVAPKVDMNAYYNVHGGCFDGRCRVLMKSGTFEKVQNLRKGDVVSNGAVIECVIKHQCENRKVEMSKVSENLLITPFHPILVRNEWTFPIDTEGGNNTAVYQRECVYNFVLSEKHIMKVEGIECCTLGHGMSENEVIKHEYFGSNKVIEDLQRLRGWEQGSVTVNAQQFKRNRNDMRVCQITQ